MKSFHSNIRLPRNYEKYDHKVINGYDLKILCYEIYITERVNNMLFFDSELVVK